MRRKPLGRDFGLSVRMAIVGSIVFLLYAAILWIAFYVAFDDPSDPRSWLVPGFAIALIYGHFRSAERLALGAIHARVVGRDEEPELYAIVDKLSGMADIPPPRIAVSPLDAPNAFVAGLTRATVAVTDGLRARLDPGELEAVLAHELSHVVHADAFVITAANLFPIMGAYLGRWRFGGADFRARKRDDREWIAWPLIMLVAVILFSFGKLLTFALSRYREYAADRGSVLLTGAPEQLMSALQKVSGDIAQIPRRDLRALSGLNALFIIPAAVSHWEIAMDHPPLRKRLDRLAEMSRELGKAA